MYCRRPPTKSISKNGKRPERSGAQVENIELDMPGGGAVAGGVVVIIIIIIIIIIITIIIYAWGRRCRR